MSHLANDILKTTKEAELGRNDWVLLPLTGILTICLILLSAETCARLVFPAYFINRDNCLGSRDSFGGTQTVPNSVCWEKRPESKLAAEYKFNSCGDRAGMECGPKPKGAYRIVMLGSSVAMGSAVPREMTFAALLPAELSRRTGRTIELYNESRGFGYAPQSVAAHFGGALSAQPDLILWVLVPHDISGSEVPTINQTDGAGAKRQGLIAKIFHPQAVLKIYATISRLPSRSRALYMLRHLLYELQTPNQYVETFLMDRSNAEPLESEFSSDEKMHLQNFERSAALIETGAKSAGVPLVAVLVPSRAQAAMISMGKWTTGYNPYKLDRELRSIIEGHGGAYIDILPEFRTVSNPEQYYFAVDGHPDANGHALISGMLSNELTGGAIPALRGASRTQTEMAKGN